MYTAMDDGAIAGQPAPLGSFGRTRAGSLGSAGGQPLIPATTLFLPTTHAATHAFLIFLLVEAPTHPQAAALVHAFSYLRLCPSRSAGMHGTLLANGLYQLRMFRGAPANLPQLAPGLPCLAPAASALGEASVGEGWCWQGSPHEDTAVLASHCGGGAPSCLLPLLELSARHREMHPRETSNVGTLLVSLQSSFGADQHVQSVRLLCRMRLARSS